MQTFHFDLSTKNIDPVLNVKQGDVGRKFKAVITDSGVAYSIPAGAQFSVWFSGPSGEGNYSTIGDNSAFTVDGNSVTVELIAQMLTNKGAGNMCLVLHGADGSQLGLWNVGYVVEQVPGMGSKAAEDYYTALSELARQAINAAATFETDTTLSVSGKAADAAAVGVGLAGRAPAENAQRLFFIIPAGSSVRIISSSAWSGLISGRGGTASTFVDILHNGYGSGGPRSKMVILQGAEAIRATTMPQGDYNGLVIWNDSSATINMTVLLLVGSLPWIEEGDGGLAKPEYYTNRLVDYVSAATLYAPAGYGYGGTVPVIQTAATDGVTFENLVDEFAATMADNSVKQVIVYDQSLTTQQFVATIWKNNQNRIVIDAVTYGNNIITAVKKLKMYSEWQPWEYVNPPMVPGVEYRTTERWDGKAVYTKLISLGYVEAGYSSFTDGVSFGTRVIRSASTHGGESVPFQPAGGNIGSYEKQISVASNAIHFYGGTSISGSYLYVQAWYVKE